VIGPAETIESLNLTQVVVAENCPANPSPVEVRAVERCAAEISPRQIRPLSENGVEELRLSKIRPTEVNGLENRPGRKCPAEIGSPKTRFQEMSLR
jgi:hypothetical protein